MVNAPIYAELCAAVHDLAEALEAALNLERSELTGPVWKKARNRWLKQGDAALTTHAATVAAARRR